MNKQILISGGSGLIGTALTNQLLSEGYEVVILSRSSKSSSQKGLTYSTYADLLDYKDSVWGIINLAGASVSNGRWSDSYKQEIYDSRINTTRKLVEFANSSSSIKVFFSGSAIGYYGDRGSEKLVESSKPKNDFMAKVCVDWEKEALKLNQKTRLIIGRIGVVLANNGGALEKMTPIFKTGLGGPIGGGEQFMSWIHIDDIVQSILFLMNDTSKQVEIANLTAPNAVKMSEFAKTLAATFNKPALFPVPGFVLKIALGEAAAIVLSSMNVYPQRLTELQYKFRFTALNIALKQIYNR